MPRYTRARKAMMDMALLDLIESSPQGLRVPNDRHQTHALADRIYNALPIGLGEIPHICRKMLGLEYAEFAVLHALKKVLMDLESDDARIRALRKSLRRGLWRQQLVYVSSPCLRPGETCCYIRSIRQHAHTPASTA